MFKQSLEITEYKIFNSLVVDTSKVGKNKFVVNKKEFHVQVVDSVDEYLHMMKDIFDFSTLRNYIKEQDLKICVNGMSGGKAAIITFLFSLYFEKQVDLFINIKYFDTHQLMSVEILDVYK